MTSPKALGGKYPSSTLKLSILLMPCNRRTLRESVVDYGHQKTLLL